MLNFSNSELLMLDTLETNLNINQSFLKEDLMIALQKSWSTLQTKKLTQSTLLKFKFLLKEELNNSALKLMFLVQDLNFMSTPSL